MSYTYTTQVDCFIGDAFRKAGATFTVDNKVDPLPKWLTTKDLTPYEKAQITKAKNAAIKQQKEDDKLIAMEAKTKHMKAEIGCF